MSPTTAITVLANTAELQKRRQSILEGKDPTTPTVRICIGTACQAKGSMRLVELFREAAAGTSDSVEVIAKCVGCHGLCELGPIVVVDPGNILYHGVEEPDVEEIFRETVLGNRVVERLLYQDPSSGERARTEEEIPFYSVQRRVVLAQNGRLDPTSLDDYLAGGGYAALARALDMPPEEIIDEVETAGLRGRGGGGFPTARKWRACREAAGENKVVICNGDEGDPGAFMDRSVMEGNPHAVIEGMIIGAFAIGANLGYIYVRNEYPLAVQHLSEAIEQSREAGLLGENILGSGFDFDVRVNRGGGAFVCGESTALMASLEGRTGEPRAKYVHTSESGLREMPTNLNNVETWANVPAIVSGGGAAFASVGTESSKGTKVFSLVGNVVNTGLVEVPMGMSLRQIVFDIGGGVPDGKAFKAVQTGGPSGGCIPAEHLDAPVDFDELTRLGSMMGSGGMIVMDEDTCMVKVAKYFLTFLKEESCGKCTPCREGIPQMLHIIERITAGEGRVEDLDTLETLCEIVGEGSLCGLGKTAVNPVRSSLRYFRDEYLEHITNRRCPARECPGLFIYEIVAETCRGCGICAKNCPVDAISGERKEAHVIDQNVCTQCGTCLEKCPFGAVIKV